LQSKLNERIVEPQDITEFLEFINNKKSDLTSIPGVKSGYAKLISDNRPYSSQEDIQKKLGAKRSLNWVRAYKQAKN
jgi:radical SAM superfamily enzyme with C-terminal helix-hairpin-helix motif